MKNHSPIVRLALLFVSLAACRVSYAQLPVEPVVIGTTPQFFVDDYMVDNRFAIKYKTNHVARKFHPPVKHPDNPVLADSGLFVNVAHNADTGKYQMWYTVHDWADKLSQDEGKTKYAIAYAESEDGIRWQEPELGLFDWMGSKANNVCFRGIQNARASGPQILLTLPEKEKRGYRYVMEYRVGGAGKENDGVRLIGSHDGIHWDPASDTRILHLHSDTLNSIVYDPVREEYMMSCRAKHIYRTFKGDIIDTGASRRVARLANKELWSEWTGQPQQLLIPDEVDARENYNFFYGMPMHYHAGIYWGFLWVFRMNDPIHTELVTSRDGIHWNRLPDHPALIPRGEEGTWDDGMIFGGPHWVEAGDEWRFYYGGSDGGHDSKERSAEIGLATSQRERLISLNGPANGGGVVITRSLVWPGGDLVLNVAAQEGEVRVRVVDAMRKIQPGFDYADCQTFTGDSTAHKVTWNDRSIDELKGQVVRLEIFLKNADLFTFRATGGSE